MTGLLLERFGTVALVTGASSGIGRAFARALAAAGMDLILVARRQQALQSLADELRQTHGVTVEVVVLDLSDVGAVEDYAKSLAGRGVSLLINNAGFGFKGQFEEAGTQTNVEMVNTNCIASIILTQYCLPDMKAAGKGGIIFTGSVEGESPFPWSATYAASKAFVHSLGFALHNECRASGVEVLVLAPGPTDTEAPRKQGFRNEELSGLMTPERVVEEALARLGRSCLWTPGWQNRLMTRLLRSLPRVWSAALAGVGLKAALAKNRAV